VSSTISATRPEAHTPPRARWLRRNTSFFGLLPFSIYVILFLLLPTVLSVGSGLFDGSGHFTWDNLAALGDPTVLVTFGNSLWLSLLASAVGAIGGSAVCYALLGLRNGHPVRVFVDAVAGTLAKFGGVMLAFIFIATIGRNSFINQWLVSMGIDIYKHGMWLYDMPGLIMPYIFFQIPLMVITFGPAMTSLRPQWAEANLALGGTRRTFWTKIGIPVLAPSFAASFLLLFANAFSAYATAAALASQGSQIVPLQIRAALTSDTVLGRQNLAGALAAGMIIVMVIIMVAYSLIQRRAEKWRA